MTYDLYINGEISDWALRDWATGRMPFQDELNIAVEKATGRDTIRINLNSGGGEVLLGFEIYNMIQAAQAQTPATIEIVNTSFVASIASVIFAAGKRSRMYKNALLMVHNPFAYTGGDSAELKKMAEVLDKMGGNIAQAYTDKVMRTKGGNKDKLNAMFLEMMDKETWLTASEALDLGLIDSILDFSAAEIEQVRVEAERAAAVLLEANQAAGVQAPAQNAAMRAAYQNITNKMRAMAQEKQKDQQPKAGLMDRIKAAVNSFLHSIGLNPKDLTNEANATEASQPEALPEAATDAQPTEEILIEITPSETTQTTDEMTAEEVKKMIDAAMAEKNAEINALKSELEAKTAAAETIAADAQNEATKLKAALASGAAPAPAQNAADKEQLIAEYMQKNRVSRAVAANAVDIGLKLGAEWSKFKKQNKNS